ncbi:hypothetical protein CANMA_005463 [Candida margitis]|uniref:uncharacterized protein n=1 Tax=Candida margitis TaxID=1775924 RepID=UPI0022276D4F|nr:uncharacterized protein CANMA_005463 [Candida margitis]KAI5949656.1 hypothetical protein CANMA_005463 [Candida margitis]
MAAARRLWVKLRLSSKYLATLPKFDPYVSKSRLKKIAQEEKKGISPSISNSQRSSPAPEGTGTPGPSNNANSTGASGSGISQYKINVGLKGDSTSGLTMNSINPALYVLDKSGKPCRRWVKKQKQFKSFTGFKMKYTAYEGKEPGSKDEQMSSAKVTSSESESGKERIVSAGIPEVKVET